MDHRMKQTTVYTDETGAEVMHFEKWLSEEEIHDIAKEQFTYACGRFLNNESNVEEIIANAIYDDTTKIINKVAFENDPDSTMEEYVRQKTRDVIDDLSQYNVFNEGYYGRGPTEGYQLLAKIVKELEPELKEKVKELSDEYLKDFSRKEMEYAMEGVIHEALFPNGEEER